MYKFIEKIKLIFFQPDFYLYLFFVICLFLYSIIIFYWLVRYKSISKQLLKYNTHLKLILNNQQDLWASWTDTTNQLLCSNSLREKLGVSYTTSVFSKHLKYFFEDFNLKAFFKAVSDHEVYEQECISINREVFSISGVKKRINQEFVYILWFRDISHRKAKTEIHNNIINDLRIENEFMKDILNNLPWPVWYKHPNKKLIFCNKAYAEALETTIEKVIEDQIHLKSWQQGCRTPNLTELVLKTKQHQVQRSHIVLHNERNYVEFNETLTSKKFILGYLNNLSELENLQEEIRHLTKSTHEILEVISLPVIIYNNNQQVEFFNNPFIKMFELDATWLETKPTFSEVLEELRAKRKLPDTEDFLVYKNRRLACFNNLLSPIEDISYYPDGRTVRMVTAPYHNGGLMITLNDITDWLTLERRYNTLLAVHRQVADNLFEGLAVFGTDHKLQLYNSAFCKMWHYTEDELIPPPHLETVIEKIKAHIDYAHYDSSWDKFKSRIKAKIIDRSTNKEGRIKLYDEVVYDYSYTPLPDGSNLLTFLDVSDRYRIEKSLLERSEALEVAHGVKSDFVFTIHQGIKYPLRRILLSFTDILEEKYGAINYKYHERLKNIWQEVDHVFRFIEDVNDLASIESGYTILNKEPININKLLDDISATFSERGLEKKINISLEANKEDIILEQGDLKRLKQVFFNLLRNAIAYATEGELVSINITDMVEEIHIEVKNFVSFIPYEDTYGASKKLKRGEQIITGLGFSLVKKIITLHNGRVILSHQKGTLVKCIFLKA